MLRYVFLQKKRKRKKEKKECLDMNGHAVYTGS